MNIPAVTNEDIIRYTKMFNKLNPALEKLMEETNQRTDVLPCIQRDTACFLQFIIQREKPLKILELGNCSWDLYDYNGASFTGKWADYNC